MQASENEESDRTTRELQYQQLPSPSHTRLLRIASKDGKQFSYEMVTVDLASHQTYNALSYTWGNPLSPSNPGKKPYINRLSHIYFKNGQFLSIGRNLATALLRFQELGLHGDIWIDAICINQSDIEERNAQVAIMGDIYANAEKVTVWLGDDDWDSQVAFVFLDLFIPKLKDLIKNEGGKDQEYSYSFTDPRLYDRLGEPMIPQEIFDGLATFLDRAWFRRAWTFQEIVLARQIDVICGTRYIDWERFEEFLRILEMSDWDLKLSRFQDSSKSKQIPGRITRSTMVYRKHVACGGPYESGQRKYLERISAGLKPTDLLIGELNSLLHSMRHRKATDLRDHVYALYGIADRFCQHMDIANPLAAPDYHGTLVQTYTEYCRAIMDKSNTLLLLSNVEDRPGESFQFPSWVPNFSKGWTIGLPSTGSGTYYDAAKGSRPLLFPSPDKYRLVLKGYCFDTVTSLGESDFELGRARSPFTKTARSLLELPTKYATGQDRAEVLWRTLIADQAQDQCPAPPEIADAFREHMLMHNSMAIFDTESFSDKGPEPETIKPLAQLATSTPEASRMIPSLPEILERKDIYAEIQATRELERSEQGLTQDQIQRGNTMLQGVLTKETKALPFARQINNIFNRKRLVTTSKGFVGAAPLSTREGDKVYLLSGGRVPFVLRARSDGTHILVGESYVHGIMQGEAFEREQLVGSQVTLV
ncbi:MAG: hypothetical protein L6R35_006335 [Caloplaca aegaea]|nr:MAG: hypothetical protein L6R35_006335 [Caloplaca aegaea]